MSKLNGTRAGFPPSARRAAREARQARAKQTAVELAPVIAEVRAAGITSLKGIAKALNARRVPTAWGKSHWHAMQVSRVLRRLPA
jgi:hypothetical protein